MWSTSQPKFCPKNPVTTVSGQEHGGDEAQLLEALLLADCDAAVVDRDDCHVRLQHRRQEVALRRGLLVDEAQVVVNVAEVRHEGLGDRPARASLERVDRRE